MKLLFDIRERKSKRVSPKKGYNEENLTEETEITIIVATHKDYWMPKDTIYLPLHVGRKGKTALRFQGDDTGEQISAKNPFYCELTGLYWGWKNLQSDYIGLVHYRRHFSDGRYFGDKKKHVMQRRNLEKLLAIYPVLLPKKRHYWIETNYSQYAHAHHAKDLELTREILEETCPDYTLAFDNVMKRTSGHRFNMFVMRRDILDKYCSWLFNILFILEERIDISSYTMNDQRVFGFVGERLLDVWLEKNEVNAKDIPYVFMEKQNWFKKGFCFIKRKIVQEGNDDIF